MAYADFLDPAIPAGGDKRKFGDDNMRQLTRAVRQRLASFFADIDADPMVPINGIIPGAALADLAVLTAKIADLAVTTGKLADGAVTAAKLAALAVATANIIDGAVTQAKLANLSVGTAQLIDLAVTSAKLAAASVLPGAIGAGTFNFDGLTIGGAAPANQFLAGTGGSSAFRALADSDFPNATLQKLLIRAEGWFVTNLPASSASFLTRWFSNLGVDRHYAVMTRAGEIRQMFIRGEADRTAGSFIVQLAKNAVAMAGATATIDAANPREVIATFAAGAQVFAAGDYISLNWSTAGFAPNNTTHVAGFEFRYTA